jgi:hypothetical protein
MMIDIDLDSWEVVIRTANSVVLLNARAISTGFHIPAATGSVFPARMQPSVFRALLGVRVCD